MTGDNVFRHNKVLVFISIKCLICAWQHKKGFSGFNGLKKTAIFCLQNMQTGLVWPLIIPNLVRTLLYPTH